MASGTYNARVIVLRKTKLGEADLILTMLAQDGSLVRAVAKGARKPTSMFASRLDLYAVADVLLSQGRSLDIVKEARLVAGNEGLRFSMEHAACAAPCAEVLDRIAQSGLENPRLFALTCAAFDAMAESPAEKAPAIGAAHILKALAFAGLRPSFSSCCVCGLPAGAAAGAVLGARAGTGDVAVSYEEGGVVCDRCRHAVPCVEMPSNTVAWMEALLKSTCKDIAASGIDLSTSFEVLRFCQQWVRQHVGFSPKSFNFLFSCGLFGGEGPAMR